MLDTWNKKLDKRFLYTVQLPQKMQAQIRRELRIVLQDIGWIDIEEEIKIAMSRKLIDLEDTIDINKIILLEG